MKTENRGRGWPAAAVMILMVGSAVVAGGGRPRPAFAIDGALQNPANGHWYKLVTSTTALSWTTCKGNAEAIGGYLATITSAAENQWVASNIGGGYIGGSDAATEGTWQWVTGEPWNYTSWNSGEPNNVGGSGGGPGEDYLVNSWAGPGLWNDYCCPVSSYIVEWDGTLPPPPPPSAPAAPSNLLVLVSNGNPISLSWTDNSDNEEGFEVERRTAATAFQRETGTGPDAVAYDDIATVPSTVYTYRVRAVNSGGASGYSNEATVAASALAPAPKAPTDLVVVSATRDSVDLAWTDNSTNEVAFEVHRRTGNNAFAFIAATEADAVSFFQTGLPPDTEFVYGVRSVTPFRTSTFVEVAAATLPTLAVTALKGDLKDSPKFGKDSLKFTASYEHLAGESDGAADFVAEGFTLRAGPDAAPAVMSLPKNLDGWKVKGTKATWKSPKGSSPKYSVQVDLATRLVKVTAAGLEFATPPANPMRVSIAVGNDGGTTRGDWETKKPGVFRLR